MKEIDFLPKWYKSDRRWQINYRTQYIVLGGVFVVMVVWNFVAAHSLSEAAEQLTHLKSRVSATENISREFTDTKNEIAQLQKQAKSIEEIDSKIDVANILAEISFLIDEKTILSKAEFIAEKFLDKVDKPKRGSVVRAMGQSEFDKKQALSIGDVRFKIVMNGVAANASDVAELICRLEDSPYFCQVYPSFSRNTELKMKTNPAEENLQVSEFEIDCYLANYQQEELYFVKDVHNKKLGR